MKETEICINEKFNEFVDNLIGEIYCGDKTYIGDDQIIEIETQRKINAKKGVIALYETYMSDNFIDAPNRLSTMFPSGKMNSFDFERLISYFLLGQFNITYSNIKQAEVSASQRRSKARGIQLEMERRIHKRLHFYSSDLDNIICNIRKHLEILEETQQPTFDFKNTDITYKKRMKTPIEGEK